MTDMRVKLCGIELKNPVIAASGTFGFGHEFEPYYDISILGGISVKGLTLKPRAGNAPPRIAETVSGMLNSVGLQNPGVDAFIEHELPYLRKFDTCVIANISGNTPEEYGVMTKKLASAGLDMIEVNVSCPNVKAGGLAFGISVDSVAEVVTEVKKYSGNVPVIVKLSPNVTDIVSIAKAAEAAGADCLSLINTLLGMRIDVNTRRPVLGNVMGGLSGPAVFPVAVRMVYQVARAVKVPVIGMGGIMTGENAAEMMLAGAAVVSVGTASIVDPYACKRIAEELKAYGEKHGISGISSLTGGVIA
ncbi:MAG: dihydroorotate dehydrogenase [Clostridiales bacterium]|nr:dihydroorotate dehydrogenase [Clostridiales bacterium]